MSQLDKWVRSGFGEEKSTLIRTSTFPQGEFVGWAGNLLEDTAGVDQGGRLWSVGCLAVQGGNLVSCPEEELDWAQKASYSTACFQTRARVHIRMGIAHLSGRSLEAVRGHCWKGYGRVPLP